jgi:hypothetical protein
MSRRAFGWGFAAAAMFVTSASVAGSPDPKSWIRQCSSSGVLETRLCDEYLRGFAAGNIMAFVMTPKAKPTFCVPDGVSVEQVRFAVLGFAQANSLVRDLLQQDFFTTNMLIHLALANVFPCSEMAKELDEK